MKRNLLLVLISGFIWLPSVHGQLLTEIPDTTRRSYPIEYYVTGGPNVRLTTGYQGMRNFYKEQGFEHFNMSEFASIGTGVLFKDRFSIDVIFDLPVDVDDTDDIMENDVIVSLKERKHTVHALFGYLFWKKRYTSLTFQTGVSWQRNRVEMEERLTGEFDFSTANRNNPRGARSIPVFYHSQGVCMLRSN